MTTTTNLGLTKDDPDERYSVQRVNANSDRIDNFAGEARGDIGDLQTAVAGKQNTLVAGVNMDASPTTGHDTVPVTSGGVYTALTAKQDTLVAGVNMDSTPTSGHGTVPVTSGGVYSFVNEGTTIAASQASPVDLDDFKTPGVYRSTSGGTGGITGNVSHRPPDTYGDVTNRGFRLIVEYAGATGYIRQTYVPAWNANQADKYFIRHYRGSGTDAQKGWSHWYVYEGVDAEAST